MLCNLQLLKLQDKKKPSNYNTTSTTSLGEITKSYVLILLKHKHEPLATELSATVYCRELKFFSLPILAGGFHEEPYNTTQYGPSKNLKRISKGQVVKDATLNSF